jgi:hemerythrin-like metal-binding protein
MEPNIGKIEWNDGLSVGIPEVDADHKRFILLVNELNQSIVGGMDVDDIVKRLLLIIDDAVQHFIHEERLFKEWKYPALDDHAHKHAAIINMLQTVMRTVDASTLLPEWIAIGLAIKETLISHILTSDMKYADFYRKNIAPDRAQQEQRS